MPSYDYQCQKCKHTFEVFHSIVKDPVISCEECGNKPCERKLGTGCGVLVPGREIWEYNDIHHTKPKWLKSRDGKTRVRYDQSKHGGRKGSGGPLPSKKKNKK